MRRLLAAMLQICAVALAMVPPSPAVAQSEPPKASEAGALYRRLGGYDRIAALVDTAFPRVATHPELTHLFRGHALDTNVRQRQLIIDRLCHDTGGPCAYTGRSLRTVHTNLKVTARQWDTFIEIIAAALDELKVPAREKGELLDLFRQRYRAETVGL